MIQWSGYQLIKKIHQKDFFNVDLYSKSFVYYKDIHLVKTKTNKEEIKMTETMTGTVKWFDSKKGYGFITPSNGDKDLFVHHTSVQMDGFKTLKEDQQVSYEVGDSDRGPVATNVTIQQKNVDLYIFFDIYYSK